MVWGGIIGYCSEGSRKRCLCVRCSCCWGIGAGRRSRSIERPNPADSRQSHRRSTAPTSVGQCIDSGSRQTRGAEAASPSSHKPSLRQAKTRQRPGPCGILSFRFRLARQASASTVDRFTGRRQTPDTSQGRLNALVDRPPSGSEFAHRPPSYDHPPTHTYTYDQQQGGGSSWDVSIDGREQQRATMQGNEAVGAVSNVLLKTLSPDRAQVCGLDGVDGGPTCRSRGTCIAR